MKPSELVDVRVQDRLRRDLAIKLGKDVIDAVEGGLNPDNAFKAIAEIFWQEQRLQRSRQQDARSYL